MLFVYLNVEEMFHTKTFCYFPLIGFAENLKSLNNSFIRITLNVKQKKKSHANKTRGCQFGYAGICVDRSKQTR